MEFTLQLTGARPMLMHNARMANPIDPWTRALSALTGKRSKTDEDLQQIMITEARGSCYETTDGSLGLPNRIVWASLYNAAKAFKQGENIKRALSYEDVTPPMYIGERTVKCEEWLSDTEHISYEGVVVAGRRVMRSRPKITPGWVSQHTFDLLTDVIDFRDLAPIIERAGRLGGVGDRRPIYGTFTAKVLDSEG